MELFSKCPIGSLFVGVIEQVQAYSRESETFVDFREKISFFIGPHK